MPWLPSCHRSSNSCAYLFMLDSKKNVSKSHASIKRKGELIRNIRKAQNAKLLTQLHQHTNIQGWTTRTKYSSDSNEFCHHGGQSVAITCHIAGFCLPQKIYLSPGIPCGSFCRLLWVHNMAVLRPQFSIRIRSCHLQLVATARNKWPEQTSLSPTSCWRLSINNFLLLLRSAVCLDAFRPKTPPSHKSIDFCLQDGAHCIY